MLNDGCGTMRRCRLLRRLLLLLSMTVGAWAPLAVAGEQLLYLTPQLVPRTGEALPAADGDSYWIVSSRRAAQHRLEPPRGSLDFFRHQEDGSLLPASAGAMQAELQPGVPVCIFVHGSFVAWEDQLVQARRTSRWIRNVACGRPLHVLFFDWPSDGPYTHLFPVDVTVRGERAEFNGLHLACLVSLLPAECPVCLIGHSHGARTVLAALHLVSAGSIQNLAFYGDVGAGRPLRAVLAAAAVDHDWLNPNQRYGRALCRSEIVNLRNRCDSALQFYPLSAPFSRPSLAKVGFTDRDRAELGPLAFRAIEVDVTELVGSSHTWPHYDSVPAIAAAIAPFVYFADGPLNEAATRPPSAELQRLSESALPVAAN